MLTLQVQQDRT